MVWNLQPALDDVPGRPFRRCRDGLAGPEDADQHNAVRVVLNVCVKDDVEPVAGIRHSVYRAELNVDARTGRSPGVVGRIRASCRAASAPRVSILARGWRVFLVMRP